MKIIIISDLHLEFNSNIPIIRDADILILPGDIGNPSESIYSSFLLFVNDKFKRTYLIAGNHEYYGRTIEDTDILIQSICDKLDNVIYLNNSSDTYEGYKFIGTTLWSQVDQKCAIINDFDKIRYMNFTLYNDLHKRARDYLNVELKKETDSKIIVITHHLPSFSLIDPQYEKYGDINKCFASKCDDLISTPIQLWCYGHTHKKSDKMINGVRCMCNPLGYPWERNKYHDMSIDL